MKKNEVIKLEGYDTEDILYFSNAQEMFTFLEGEGEYFFEQNLIYINNRPAFFKR